MTADRPIGVSVVVPVHNGGRFVIDTLEAVFAQQFDQPIEVIAVDDVSADESAALLREVAKKRPLLILRSEGRGAAAAINTGIRAARYPIICQVDQDVVIGPHFLRVLVAELDDPTVAAAQGYYTAISGASLVARVAALDLHERYARIAGHATDHVCTGNTVYRTSVLHQVGLFDETLGYGYDNDLSYRLLNHGYELRLCRQARSVHRWREGLAGYAVQQYGLGYGRLDIVAKHPRRVSGDAVSPAGMMAHPFFMTMVVGGLALAALCAAAGGPWRSLVLVSAMILSALVLERVAVGLGAAARFKESAGLWFAPVHLVRDLAWVAAVVIWSGRRLFARPRDPAHSMRPTFRAERSNGHATSNLAAPRPVRRVLGLIPAHNEAKNLRAVVAEVREEAPALDILVIDDGSDDETAGLLPQLGVRWLTFPHRLGIGSSVRAGLRYAHRLGYDAAIRVDGDGQHCARDIELLLRPIDEGRADVVLGSRYAARDDTSSGRRILQRMLAVCLSLITRARVTDPTSGFCAVGPGALGLLAEHHPTGYPEAELRLFLSRNRVRVIEVPVAARARLGGTTSLTVGRLAAAAARVLLAMIVVPLRSRVRNPL